jgi:hypothetical protein
VGSFIRGDCNVDGAVLGQVTAAIYLLSFNFLDGPPPAARFPQCESSPRASDQTLGCLQPLEGCGSGE